MKKFCESCDWWKAVIGVVAVLWIGCAGAQSGPTLCWGDTCCNDFECWEPSLVHSIPVTIDDAPGFKVVIDDPRGPDGVRADLQGKYPTFKPGRHVQDSSCNLGECLTNGARYCRGVYHVASVHWWTGTEPITCMVQCSPESGVGRMFEDSCGGAVVEPPADEPYQCGQECPGACQDDCACCPDCQGVPGCGGGEPV